MSVMEEILSATPEKAINAYAYQIQYGDHPVLVIKHPTCVAAISLYGAHLLFWRPATETLPVIWLSDQSEFRDDTPIRGGVPICWPWFGKGGIPMHGFARVSLWTLNSCAIERDGVRVQLSLTTTKQTKRYWPHDFELVMDIKLGQTCEIMLSNSGDFEAMAALHTYFGVSDISAINITGLGPTYEERLSTVNQPRIAGEMTFNQEVDRIYDQPEPVIYIKDTSRTIKVTHVNHSDVVTWNPWIEKTAATSDLANNSYRDFVCVETCRINKMIKSQKDKQMVLGVKIAVLE